MQGRIIVRNKKYSNCFVAMPTFKDNRVIAHGQNASKVRKEAIERGYKRPVVFFVPPRNAVCIY